MAVFTIPITVFIENFKYSFSLSFSFLQGNVNYARARQALMESTRFGKRLKELFPIIEEGMSDSGCFDNLLEFLCYCSTRSLPEVVISMIPEAWQADEGMPDHKRFFYKWAASLLEPWDGPGKIFIYISDFLTSLSSEAYAQILSIIMYFFVLFTFIDQVSDKLNIYH